MDEERFTMNLKIGRIKTRDTNGDPLSLQSSDYARMVLVSTQLTGITYRSWRRVVRIALGAKCKLDFINWKVVVMNEDMEEFEHGQRIDYMIIS